MYTPGKSIISLAVVDDHTLVREALSRMIDSWDYCKVILQASGGAELIHYLQNNEYAPDIVLCDLSMPGVDGIDTTKWITQHRPVIKVIVLSGHETTLSVLRACKAGAVGFVNKNAMDTDLKKAIKQVMKTGSCFSHHNAFAPASARFLKNRLPYDVNDTEMQFLKYACSEMTYKQIADKLHLSIHQVDHMREDLFHRFDVKSRVSLAIKTLHSGIQIVK